MRLHNHDLKQMDDDYLDSLEVDRLRTVSKKLLADLKDARERLDQNPQNSSVPPSSRPAYLGIPMEDAGSDEDADGGDEPAAKKDSPASEPEQDDNTPVSPDGSEEGEQSKEESSKEENGQGSAEDKTGKTQPKRKAGKQPGTPGFGRTQVIPPHRVEVHRANQCAACGEILSVAAIFATLTGFHVIDIKEHDGQHWGMELECTLHHYGETVCGCGHRTRLMPGKGDGYESADGTVTTTLNEWRLIGPRLASFIVFLTYRMHLSRAKVREFLEEWMGLQVSTGTIDNCLRESALAAWPVYLALLNAIQREPLVHVDETPWREKGTVPWLWVFISNAIVLFVIDRRRQEVVLRILMETFAGWLMSDGLMHYRMFPRRLRCLAHLIRKARGLAESLTEEACEFGETALAILATVLDYRTGECTLELVQQRLASFRKYCELVADNAEHQKTQDLAKEFLNDWDAIWQAVEHPELPATNNLAERMLRHWVIARRISYGTRTPEGSRAVAILASIVETGRLRGIKIWDYLTQVIAAGRRGETPLPMPLPIATG